MIANFSVIFPKVHLVRPFLKYLFLNIAFWWQAFLSLEFIKGTGRLTICLCLSGAWLSMTYFTNVWLNQYVSSKSSNISPTWFGVISISYLKDVSSKFLKVRYWIRLRPNFGKCIFVLKATILWKSLIPVLRFRVSATFLFFDVIMKSRIELFSDLKQVGSSIKFDRSWTSLQNSLQQLKASWLQKLSHTFCIWHIVSFVQIGHFWIRFRYKT